MDMDILMLNLNITELRKMPMERIFLSMELLKEFGQINIENEIN